MPSKRNTRLRIMAANCGICERPIDFPSGFFFDSGKAALGIVHPDCMSYEMHRGHVRPGSVVQHDCGDASCVNPAHLTLELTDARYDPCTFDGSIPGKPVVCCSTATVQEWWFDHFHGSTSAGPCSHRHDSWAEAEACVVG